MCSLGGRNSLALAQFVLFSPGLVVWCLHWSQISSFYHFSGSAGPLGCLQRSSEHFLRGIGDIQEAVTISVAGIHLPHVGRDARHALLRHQEKQSLGGVQSDFIPGGETVGEAD